MNKYIEIITSSIIIIIFVMVWFFHDSNNHQTFSQLQSISTKNISTQSRTTTATHLAVQNMDNIHTYERPHSPSFGSERHRYISNTKGSVISGVPKGSVLSGVPLRANAKHTKSIAQGSPLSAMQSSRSVHSIGGSATSTTITHLTNRDHTFARVETPAVETPARVSHTSHIYHSSPISPDAQQLLSTTYRTTHNINNQGYVDRENAIYHGYVESHINASPKIRHRAPVIGGDEDSDPYSETTWGTWLQSYYRWLAGGDGSDWENYIGQTERLEEWWNTVFNRNGDMPSVFPEFQEWAVPVPSGIGILLLLIVVYTLLKGSKRLCVLFTNLSN